MCLSPLTIDNKSVYRSRDYSFEHYTVPCGKCLECRSSVQTEWRTRISHEISSLYRRGGLAIFLTFTYSDDCLPRFERQGINVPCFNRDDVLTFLNRLKVKAYRKFGKHSYKYFVTSEYGKNTKRPHYHGLFFLQPGVNWMDFALLCRDAWTFGFMFPKYSKTRSCFVDDKHSYSEIRIRSLVGGAKYVSKYVTKDLSFYEIPEVNNYLASEDAWQIKPFLPKHWQSNLLGVSILDDINLMDDKSVVDALNNGVCNPLTMRYEPLPRFVVNKLCYKNVFRGRFNAVGTKLYDRQLTTFGCLYFKKVFASRISNTKRKVFECFSQLVNGSLHVDDIPLPDLRSLDVDVMSRKVSFFHHLWSNVSPDVFCNFITMHNGVLDDLFDVDASYHVWLHAKDSLFLKLRKSPFVVSCFADLPSIRTDMRAIFANVTFYHYLYMYVSTCQRLNRLCDSEERQKRLDDLRYMYMSNFNKNLC